MSKILTFREYQEFDRVSSKEEYRRNISYYDPQKGWVLDLGKKQTEEANSPKL